MSSESDREDHVRLVHLDRSPPPRHLFCHALLLWVTAAAVLFGSGGLTAQAQQVDEDPCDVTGATVITGDLSAGVNVQDENVTTLCVRDLIDNIAPADRTIGIAFTGAANADITLDVNTGSYGIVTRGASGINVTGSGGTTKVFLTGDIKASGNSARGIDLSNNSGNVEAYITGDIETFGTERSGGINADSIGGNVKIDVTGNIVVRSGSGILAASDTNLGTVEVIVEGDITNWGPGNGINTSSDDGNITITLNGGSIASAGRGIYFYNGGNSSDAENTLTINNAVTISGATYDVQGGFGDETIDNYGALTTLGVIDLGQGDNRFNNKAGATFNSGTFVTLSHGDDGDDGNFNDDVFTNEGDLSPGGASEMQTTELAGNFVNKESGTYTVTIGSTAGANDKLIVTGKITLDGGTVRVVGAYVGRYKILESKTGAIQGQGFDEVIDTLFMNYELDNDVSSDVWLTSARNTTSFLEATGVTGTANQRAVANALDSLDPTDPDNQDTDNPIARAFLDLNTAEAVRAASDALSGEVYASLKGALMMDTVQRPVAAVNRRLNARLGYPDARRSTATIGNLSSRADSRSGLWMTGYGASGETEATANTAQMDMNLSGGLLGIDRPLGKHWRVGVLGSYSQTNVTQRARVSSVLAETWSVGLYSGAKADALRLRLGALYNRHAITASRTVGINDFSDRLSARYNAQSWQFFAETGYRMVSRYLMLEPFAGVSYTGFSTDGFSETGGEVALTASAETDKMTFSTLGMRSAVQMIDDTVHATGMAGWRHAFDDTDPSSTFTMSGSATSFTGWGAPIAEDAVVTELGLEANLLGDAIFGVAYNGRYGDGVTAHGFNASLKVAF